MLKSPRSAPYQAWALALLIGLTANGSLARGQSASAHSAHALVEVFYGGRDLAANARALSAKLEGVSQAGALVGSCDELVHEAQVGLAGIADDGRVAFQAARAQAALAGARLRLTTLREALGSGAGQDLVASLDRMAEQLSELRAKTNP